MTRAWVVALLVLALAVSAGTARAGGGGRPFIGHYLLSFGGGWSHFSEYRNAHDDASLSEVDVDEWDDHVRGSIGFAGIYTGLEIGYESIGHARLRAVSDGSGARWLPGRLGARLSGYAFTGSVLLRAPAGERWVSQARFGLLQWRTTERTTEAGPLVSGENTATGTSLVAGVGGELRLGSEDRTWLRLEVARSAVGESDLAYFTFSGSFVLHY